MHDRADCLTKLCVRLAYARVFAGAPDDGDRRRELFRTPSDARKLHVWTACLET